MSNLTNAYSANIFFLEKPATDDERLLAILLNNLAQAINSKDINLLASVYADDAQIAMIGKGVVMSNKSEYLNDMPAVFNKLYKISFRDVYIRFRATDSDAVISCSSWASVRGSVFPSGGNHLITCKKVSGSWVISSVHLL